MLLLQRSPHDTVIWTPASPRLGPSSRVSPMVRTSWRWPGLVNSLGAQEGYLKVPRAILTVLAIAGLVAVAGVASCRYLRTQSSQLSGDGALLDLGPLSYPRYRIEF